MSNFNFYNIIRPLLFTMDAETAHHFSLKALKKIQCSTLQTLMQIQTQAPTTLMGLPLKNPVGLAAGLDKNGEFIDALSNFGFGFIEVGTVTPKAQEGNPKPRLFRLEKSKSLINRFGFNNDGLDVFIRNVQESNFRQRGGILGLNIGKNATTPIENALDDYLLGLEGVYAHADYITVNISSPNTKNLRALQGEDELAALLGGIRDKRKALADQHGRYVPIALKIAPDLTSEQIKQIAHSLQSFEMDGVIATNTTLTRDAVMHEKHANETGGLSGPAVHELSLTVIRQLRQELGADFAIIGVGGIDCGKKAIEKIHAGANAVQIYTGLIYHGPKLIHDCIKSLKSIAPF